MAAFGRLQVIDKGGWLKEFELSKSLIYVGSDPGNDIVLDPQHGAGVAGRHLQILYLATPSGAGLLRVINLGRADISLDPRSPAVQASVLRPWSAAVIGDNTSLQLGDFSLTFQVDVPSVEVLPLPGTEEPSPLEATEAAPIVEQQPAPVLATDIGLDLHLEGTRLEAGEPLVGRIAVRNQGDEPAVQIRLALEGLDAGSYEMGPGPILFPNAEKEVSLRILHSGKPWPVAGEHRIRISATAPQAYPGQRAEVSGVMWIAPLYGQELHLLDSDPGAKQTIAVEIHNTGNTRGRYELLAEDADGALGYIWSLQGEAAAEGTVAAQEPGSERPGVAISRDGLAAGVAKVRTTGQFANAMAGMLASLGSILPSPAGAWLLKGSNALRANQMRAAQALGAPSRTARSLKSLLPRPLQPGWRAPATKQVAGRQSSQAVRGTQSASYQTPFIEPGQRLVVELGVRRLRRQGGRYTIRITSHRLDLEGVGAVEPGVTAERSVQIEGAPWGRLLLAALVALLILSIALGLAYGLRQGR